MNGTGGDDELAETKNDLVRKLNAQKLKDWDDLPDIGLYIDQVLVFLKQPHMCIGAQENENFTRPMINNYIKQGLVPHPDGKKYSREHLAFLVAISLLKQVMSISDARDFLNITMKGNNPFSAFYRYRDQLNSALDMVIGDIGKESGNDMFPAKKIIEYSAKSYAYKLLAGEMLDIYRGKDGKAGNVRNGGKDDK